MERCSVWDGMWIERGELADYEALSGFHYRGGRPGGVMRVWVARYAGNAKPETQNSKRDGAGDAPMRAGVLVECLPALGCALRNVALSGRYSGMDRKLSAAKLNREVRTIARVVVHPMFRATGLAVELVRRALAEAETPFVEALAAMGRVNRFFERAGMEAYQRPMDAEGVRLCAAIVAEAMAQRGCGHGDAETRGRGEVGKAEELVRGRIGEAASELVQIENQKSKIEKSGSVLSTQSAVLCFLADLRAEEFSPFLAGELKRFARKKEGVVEEWLEEARGRLFSWPVYFLWKEVKE